MFDARRGSNLRRRDDTKPNQKNFSGFTEFFFCNKYSGARTDTVVGSLIVYTLLERDQASKKD